MQRILIGVVPVVILFMIAGCSQYRHCAKVPFLIGHFNKSNFDTVSYDNFHQIKFTSEDDKAIECPPPEDIKVPKSIVYIKDMLSKGQRVSLYIKSKSNEGGGVYESRWENLYLKLFGTNGNFSIMDSGFFSKVDRSQTKVGIKESSFDEIAMASQTDRTKFIELTGVTHIYVMDYQHVRTGPFVTHYFGGRLIDIATGKVVVVDEGED